MRRRENSKALLRVGSFGNPWIIHEVHKNISSSSYCHKRAKWQKLTIDNGGYTSVSVRFIPWQKQCIIIKKKLERGLSHQKTFFTFKKVIPCSSAKEIHLNGIYLSTKGEIRANDKPNNLCMQTELVPFNVELVHDTSPGTLTESHKNAEGSRALSCRRKSTTTYVGKIFIRQYPETYITLKVFCWEQVDAWRSSQATNWKLTRINVI